MDGRTEVNQHVAEAAFGKSLCGVQQGTFYRVQLVGDQNCSFNYQTALFSLKNPESLIAYDNQRFVNMNALDLLSKEARKKVSCGVPISFLLEDMTPWNLVTTFKIEGTRSTAYGSELVPRGDDTVDSAISNAFTKAGITVYSNWSVSSFMLLPDTMGRLCRQLNCKPSDLYDMEFLLHRDPALPDGTDLFPAKYAGMLKWNGSENGQGIVLHPQDPNWRLAGGDFDGDACAIYLKQPFMQPISQIHRPNYRIRGRKYKAETIAEQMVEAAADKTPGLLGSVILGTMRLIERDLGDETNRALSAAVAQASVDAKKHPVDHDAVLDAYWMLLQQVKEGREIIPEYISDYLNAMGNAKGTAAKLAVWDALCTRIDAGWWKSGSPVERALIQRVNVLRTLFEEVKWYRELQSQQLPQTIKQAAVAKVNDNALIDAVTQLTEEYVQNTSIAAGCEDDDAKPFRDRIRELRTNAKLLAITGAIGTLRVDPIMAQYALIAFGPQRLAAQFVPSERFEELTGTTKHLFISLIGTSWQSGDYNVNDINPIPNSARHWEQFAKSCGDTVNVVVLGTAARSTRVKIETLR
jgi:hypothetical protein